MLLQPEALSPRGRSLISEQISKKRPDAAVPPGKFDGELLLSRLCWRWAEHAGHQGHYKNVIESTEYVPRRLAKPT